LFTSLALRSFFSFVIGSASRKVCIGVLAAAALMRTRFIASRNRASRSHRSSSIDRYHPLAERHPVELVECSLVEALADAVGQWALGLGSYSLPRSVSTRSSLASYSSKNGSTRSFNRSAAANALPTHSPSAGASKLRRLLRARRFPRAHSARAAVEWARWPRSCFRLCASLSEHGFSSVVHVKIRIAAAIGGRGLHFTTRTVLLRQRRHEPVRLP
jgi:hypothetical protein